VKFEACLEAICISMTALNNSWASLNVIMPLDGNRTGVLVRPVSCSEAKGV
jgi:hypothetical protein